MIFIDPQKCTQCGICVETCGVHIFAIQGSEIRTRREDNCIACGHCVAVCPVDAIHHPGLDLPNFISQREDIKIPPEFLYHFLRSRRSCRTFKPAEVPRELLEQLVDIGRYAPSGTNIQDVEFIAVQHQSEVAQLSRMAGMFYERYLKTLEESKEPVPYHTARRMNAFRLYSQYAREGKDRIFRGGQAAIMVHGPMANAVAPENCHYALFHIILTAHAMGLGTCLLRTFCMAAENDPEIQKELGLPEGHKIFGCISLGFPKYKFYKLPARRSPQVRWL